MNALGFSALAFDGEAIVSRETMDKLRIYQELLTKWNPRINLIGASTLPDAWTRHFVDSAQLWKFQSGFGDWMDLGSGAGFPGLVLAIISSEITPASRFFLVESDARKCAFLRNVVRETEVSVEVHNTRIENITGIEVDVVSARALAPLKELMQFSVKLLRPGGYCLFLKGQNCDTEITEASKEWEFQQQSFHSVTDSRAKILRIEDLKRAANLPN